MNGTRPLPRRALRLLAIAALASTPFSLSGCSNQAGADSAVTSICEAKLLKAANPDFQIPPELDTPWPSLAACRSYVAAGDPDAPGPLQPIPFSHKHHAGTYQMECMYCHTGTDVSQAAGVPSVELCMGCHEQFPTTYENEFEGIRTLFRAYGYPMEENNGKWERGERDPEAAHPIEWAQIHRVPEHVQFRHNRHIAAGVDCQRCHGPVQEMEKLYLTEDTVWWPWLLPAAKLEMGWCIQCHRENNASQDCLVCHY